MHFFIIAIPVVIILSKRPSIGAAVLGGIILVSILIPFLVTYLKHKPALVNFYVEYVYHDSMNCPKIINCKVTP
jgi:hypothetical protein